VLIASISLENNSGSLPIVEAPWNSFTSKTSQQPNISTLLFPVFDSLLPLSFVIYYHTLYLIANKYTRILLYIYNIINDVLNFSKECYVITVTLSVKKAFFQFLPTGSLNNNEDYKSFENDQD